MHSIIAAGDSGVIDLLLDALTGDLPVSIERRPLGDVSGTYDVEHDRILVNADASRDEQRAGLAVALAALVQLDAVPRRPALRLVPGGV